MGPHGKPVGKFHKRKKGDTYQGKNFDHSKKYGVKKRPIEQYNEELQALQERYNEIDPASFESFSDIPLSKKTIQGLKEAGYSSPTDIQKQSIGLALKGHDILGAAKTGSGKTLAFLVPVLECLYREKWSAALGLGALIISPTRELAYQTFEVLRKIGKKHGFSAGLVIGGKHVREERERINKTNIVICTPGRLLQHMDETAYFQADALQILVLDEADRILDLGFQQTMNSIIENLPSQRQTLLFSATQTKSVKDLARLSLKSPLYVSVHEHAEHSTPSTLEQSYMVVELHEKMDLLWSFLKFHQKSKILAFFQSCKQVRYVYEAIKKLRPGITVLCLHGAMNQLKRVAVYDQFCRKQSAVLFATDIAARGLDFPEVSWVIQMDCPEDANTYIHRAGRTARFKKDGEALLVLLPSEEEAMAAQLQEKKIPINKIKANPSKQWSIQGKLDSLCASDVTLKEAAQRAFISYLRSTFLMANKKVFNVHKLDTDKYASSLGLAVPPRIRFLQKEQKRIAEKEDANKVRSSTKETSLKTQQSESADSSDEESDDDQEEEEEEKKTEVGDKKESGLLNFGLQDEDGDELFTVKSKSSETHVSSSSEDEEIDPSDLTSSKKSSKAVTKYAVAKKLLKKNMQLNMKVKFDEEGEEVVVGAPRKPQVVLEGMEDEGGINIEIARQRMQEEDKLDKQRYREMIKKRHKEERLKKREERGATRIHPDREMVPQEQGAVLGGASDEEGSGEEDQDDDGFNSDSYDVDGSEGEEEEEEGPSSKRARLSQQADEGAEDDDEDDDEEDDDEEDDDEEDDDEEDDEGDENDDQLGTDLSIREQEELALKLLQS